MKDFIKEPLKKTKILFEKLDKRRNRYTQGLLHKLGEKIRRQNGN